MASAREFFDVPNPAITSGEYFQDIRDRNIGFLGISSIAGYLEDLGKHSYPASVRARWSRIDNVASFNPAPWQEVKPVNIRGRLPKNKPMAVIVGAHHEHLSELWDSADHDKLWPSAAYEYRGVQRAGLLPHHFGIYEPDYVAVALLIGQSTFKVTMGLTSLEDRRNRRLSEIRRREIKRGTLQPPLGVKILEVMPADDIPLEIPLA